MGIGSRGSTAPFNINSYHKISYIAESETTMTTRRSHFRPRQRSPMEVSWDISGWAEFAVEVVFPDFSGDFAPSDLEFLARFRLISPLSALRTDV